MKHITNVEDPANKNARLHFETMLALKSDGLPRTRQELKEAWKAHIDWYDSFTIGPPKGTDKYSMGELMSFGLVGLYRQEDDSNNQN